MNVYMRIFETMIEDEILSRLQRGQRLALVTIVDKSGSAPRLPGSKMVVARDGSQAGTIGGGRLEHCARQAALEVVGGAAPRLLEFDMRGTDGDADMICGGVQMILVERIMPELADLFSEALSCLDRGGQGVWIIDITRPDAPQRKFVDLDREIPSATGQDLPLLLRRRVTRLIQSEGKRLVVDPLPQNGTVVLFGGGHVSLEVARLAQYVDFGVVVCDDREEFASQDRFPMARRVHVLPGFADIAGTLALHEECYLLILTRGHRYDQVVLAQALRSRARYIGMIGSRKKRDRVYANLRQEGFGEADFARVHCPVGMAIGSESPREIGISIVGELIAARAGAL